MIKAVLTKPSDCSRREYISKDKCVESLLSTPTDFNSFVFVAGSCATFSSSEPPAYSNIFAHINGEKGSQETNPTIKRFDIAHLNEWWLETNVLKQQ